MHFSCMFEILMVIACASGLLHVHVGYCMCMLVIACACCIFMV
jgi:hypothetical protein